MSELKTRIIEKISSITDESILEEISRFVSREINFEESYKLTPEEREGVEKGLEDVKSGKVYTSEEAKNMMRKWLNR